MKTYFRTTLLALFLTASATYSFGQRTYTVSADSDVVTKLDTAGLVVLEISVTNTTSAQINIKWTILEDGFHFSGWNYSFCDLITCFTNGYNTTGTDPLDPKGSGGFTITVNQFNHIAENERMKLVIWDVKNTSITDTLVLAINATRLGIESNKVPASFINLYPNPAQDYLQLNSSTTAFQPAKAIILNSLGQEVSTQTFTSGTDMLPIAGLGKGMYFIRISDNEGREAVKQFVKE